MKSRVAVKIYVKICYKMHFIRNVAQITQTWSKGLQPSVIANFVYEDQGCRYVDWQWDRLRSSLKQWGDTGAPMGPTGFRNIEATCKRHDLTHWWPSQGKQALAFTPSSRLTALEIWGLLYVLWAHPPCFMYSKCCWVKSAWSWRGGEEEDGLRAIFGWFPAALVIWKGLLKER